MKLKVYLLAFIIGLAAVSCTDHLNPDPVSQTDRIFIDTLLDCSRFIFSASAGANNKTTDSIFKFSGDMVAYITPVKTSAEVLAQSLNIPISSTFSPHLQARYNTLTALGVGLAYDTTYVNVMIPTMEEMLAYCRLETQSGSNQTFKDLAQNQIVYLKDFLQRAYLLDSLQRL